MESLALKHNAIHVQLIRCFILDHQVWSLKYNTMSHLNYSHSFCPQLLSTRSCSFVIMLVAQHNKNQNLVNVVTGCQTQCHTFNPLLHTRSSSLISEVQYRSTINSFVNFNVVQHNRNGHIGGSNTMPHFRLLLPPAVVAVQHTTTLTTTISNRRK